MKIRPYVHSDTDAIVRLLLRAWAAVFESIERAMIADVYHTFHPDWGVVRGRAVESVLANPEQNVWVAKRKAGPVGFVAVVPHRADSMREGNMIAVDPDHQAADL